MDTKTDRETHDFMNVESFSQLPFIRPPPKEKCIRLFGKVFGGGSAGKTEKTSESGSADTNPSEEMKDQENGESNRRFECHYCCRNFPTSQALGGHQNAHKRERQHAKRAHLQSAMMHNSVSESDLYGYMSYRPQTMTYPSWNNSAGSIGVAGSSRFYGSHEKSSFSQAPINGSPLGLWHIPSSTQSSYTFSRERSSQSYPRLVGDEFKRSQVGGSNAQSRYAYESKTNLQDHVSLDLHL